MKRNIVHISWLLLMVGLFFLRCGGDKTDYLEISESELREKIAGGWAGKMIGVTYGGPTEFDARGETYEDEKKRTYHPLSIFRISNITNKIIKAKSEFLISDFALKLMNISIIRLSAV